MARLLLGAVAVLAALGFLALVVLSEMHLGYGQGLLDGRVFGYDATDVQAYLTLLPEAGRSFYLGPFRALDTVIPPLLAISFGGVIWLYGQGAVRLLVILPLIYVSADLMENATVAQLLKAWPETVDPSAVDRASLLTQIKWAFTLLSLASAMLIWRRTRGKK